MTRVPELRCFKQPAKVEKRADGKEVIAGYAAVFYDPTNADTEYELWEGAYERIMRTAFDAALREKDDVRGLFNHSVDSVLGRLSAGTLRLSVDTVGLAYEIDPPPTSDGKDVVELLRRGDIDGSSFSFLIYSGKRGRVTWTEEKLADGTVREVREIHDLELIDVGPVTFPAYAATVAGLRSEGSVEILRAERDRARAADLPSADDVAVRLAQIRSATHLRA